ncbi:hypothetical protein IJG90_04525 [Candidatus Saccharibacteria bacterium]|nr:hypothetical protein [Candidatus Saccharibacteria bacterium]
MNISVNRTVSMTMLGMIASAIGLVMVVIVAYISAQAAKAFLRQLKKVIDGKEISTTTEKVLSAALILLGLIGALTNNIVLTVALAILLIIGFTSTANVDEGPLSAAFFSAVGTPIVAAIIFQVIKNSIVWGWDPKRLLWLIGPVAFYALLAVCGQISKQQKASAAMESTLAAKAILAVIAVAALATVAILGYSQYAIAKAKKAKTAKTVDTTAVTASTTTKASTKVAKEEVVKNENSVATLNAKFANHGTSAEEAAAEEGIVLPQLDPADSESKLSDYALGPMSEDTLSPMREWLGWNVSWDSYPADPVTDTTMTIQRTHSAKELGYVDYSMSYATAPGFPKDWKEYVASRGMDPNTTEEEAVYRWVGDLTGNYPAFIGMVELYAEAKTLGVKNRDIEGNEFFNEILNLAKAAEDEGKGVTKFLDASATPAYSKYNFDWQTYRAKFMYWLSLTDFAGRKEWLTREKSYLGPADNTVSANMIHKFDYTNVGYIRPNFTTAEDRQTSLPSYPFCFKDKNGHRVSDFFGVNATNADAELYSEQKAVKKSQLKQSGYNPTKTPEQNNKAAAKAEAKQKSSTTSSSKKKKDPDPTPKKKYDKHKEKSSVNKPENIIDGKDPKGVGTDNFQPVGTQPTNWGSTVETAQYQPQAITSTHPGESHEVSQAPGTTETTTSYDPSTGYTTVTTTTATENPDTGAVTTDVLETTTSPSGESESSYTENAEASTPEIHEEADHDGDGDSSSNTDMPEGDF